MQNVLDDVVDKEADSRPKLVGPPAPGSVGSAARHISPEELDAYVEGRLSGARLDFVRGHLDACEACRAELTDLRTSKASAVGLNQASSLKRELERRRRHRMLKTGAAAAVAAAVVAAGGVVAWNKFGKAWVHRMPVAARVQTPVAAPVRAPVVAAPRAVAPVVKPPEVRDARTASAQPHATPEPAATQPHATVAAVAPATSGVQAREAMPATAPAVVAGSTSFALLGPFGNEISDDRPEFAWQPLEGATKYSIIIVDEGLRPIAHTRLKTTTWRPKKPLRRGRTYLWQVTAILKNGTKVMASGPTSHEARIHIGAPPK
jgi:hypothetical protein